MIVIRKEQMKIFSQYQLDTFFETMEQSLKRKYSVETKNMARADLRELVEVGVVEAEKYGIKDENDVSRFLEYLVIYGRDFGQLPEMRWAYQFLSDPELTGSEKINQLDSYELFVITLGK